MLPKPQAVAIFGGVEPDWETADVVNGSVPGRYRALRQHARRVGSTTSSNGLDDLSMIGALFCAVTITGLFMTLRHELDVLPSELPENSPESIVFFHTFPLFAIERRATSPLCNPRKAVSR